MKEKVSLFLALIMVSCTSTQVALPSPTPTATSVVEAFLSAKSTLTATPKPTPLPSPSALPGYSYVTVRLIDRNGTPYSFDRFGPEVFAYPATREVCEWIRTGGLIGSTQDKLVEDWGHFKPDGSFRLLVKNPGRYVIFVAGEKTLLWWKGKATCDSADPLQVDQDAVIDFVY